jgi:TRAP-type C4-dicarboxylate transport system permease small subunit
VQHALLQRFFFKRFFFKRFLARYRRAPQRPLQRRNTTRNLCVLLAVWLLVMGGWALSAHHNHTPLPAWHTLVFGLALVMSLAGFNLLLLLNACNSPANEPPAQQHPKTTEIAHSLEPSVERPEHV